MADSLTRESQRWPLPVRTLRTALLRRGHDVPFDVLAAFPPDRTSRVWRWIGTGKQRPGWLKPYRIEGNGEAA